MERVLRSGAAVSSTLLANRLSCPTWWCVISGSCNRYSLAEAAPAPAPARARASCPVWKGELVARMEGTAGKSSDELVCCCDYCRRYTTCA